MLESDAGIFGGELPVGFGVVGISALVVEVDSQVQPTTGGVRSNARENGQISPLDCRSGCRCDGIRPLRASVLQESRKSANIHASSGFIRGIPVKLRSIVVYGVIGGSLALVAAYGLDFGGYISAPDADMMHEREVFAAAGIAGGLVYWLFAGRRAGAWT